MREKEESPVTAADVCKVGVSGFGAWGSKDECVKGCVGLYWGVHSVRV